MSCFLTPLGCRTSPAAKYVAVATVAVNSTLRKIPARVPSRSDGIDVIPIAFMMFAGSVFTHRQRGSENFNIQWD